MAELELQKVPQEPQEPPVLNVNPSPPTELNELSPQNGEDGSEGNENEVTQRSEEIPPTIPGLNQMLDEWQMTGISEEMQFFSTNGNILDAAITAIKARLDERDSNIRKTWLLTEIDHWDLEKERIIILTDNNLIVVKYDFKGQLVEELKFIPLAVIRKVSVGDFKYTHSFAYSRTGKGLKIHWSDEPVSFVAKWNPFSSDVPHTILTSHVLIMRNKSVNPRLKFDTLPEELVQAIKDFRARSQPSGTVEGEEIDIVEEDIIFDYYVGLSAMIHNQSFLGFFKKRGILNW